MAKPWERLFVAMARLAGWCVVLVPAAALGIVAFAAFAGHQPPDPMQWAGRLAAELGMTLLIAGGGALSGACVGVGSALLVEELPSGWAGKAIGMLAGAGRSFPALVFGWFAATVILRSLPPRDTTVGLAAGAVVMMLVVPRAHALMAHALRSLPPSLRESAAAAGANGVRIAAHVSLPACGRRVLDIFGDALSRGLGEAAGVGIVFLAAAQAGYPLAHFTLAAALIARAGTAQPQDASIAQAALLAAALGVGLCFWRSSDAETIACV